MDSSIYRTILDSAKTVLDDLFLEGVGTIAVRKRPVFIQELDTLPALIVSGTEERVKGLTFGGWAVVAYPVYVTVLRQSSLDPEDLDSVDLRGAVRNALYRTTLAGAATVFDCDYDPRPAFDAGKFGDLFDVSVQLFTYLSDEPRSG